MSGYEVAKAAARATRRARGLRLFAMTGYGQEEDRRRSLDAGFDGHLVKPVALGGAPRGDRQGPAARLESSAIRSGERPLGDRPLPEQGRPDDRRRGSTRKLSGKRTDRTRGYSPDSGERRQIRPPKGPARAAGFARRNLSGTKDRGVRRAMTLAWPFSFAEPERPCSRPPPSTQCTAPPAPAWSISAAGTCRSTTARRSRSTTRCAATAGLFDVSHMQVVDIEGTGRARLPAPRARQQRRQAARSPGKALYSCLLNEYGRRGRRPHRLLLPRRLLPPRGERGHRREGHRVARAASRERMQARGAHHAAARPRDARDPGAARARGLLAGVPGTRAATEALAPFSAALAGEHDGRAHRLHRRGRLRDRASPPTAPRTVWNAARRRRRAARGPGRARHAAPRGRHEPLRPGHGRGRLAARRRPRVDRGPRRAARDFVGREALEKQGPGARVPRPAAPDKGGVLRAHQRVRRRQRRGRDHQRHVLAHARAVDRARAPAPRHEARRHRAGRWCATSSSPRAW